MIRKFRALGLALVAVLAMSAFVASAAQAIPTVSTTKSPVEVHGTGEGVNEKFQTEGGAVECKVSHYTGTVVNGSSSIRLTPTYTECKAFGFVSATVTTTGCHYLFHLTEKVANHHYRANADVECTTTDGPPHVQHRIIIVAGTCEVAVDSQTGLPRVEITNMTAAGETPADVTIKPNLTAQEPPFPEGSMNGKNGPIKYTVLKDGFGCPMNGVGAKTGGEYSTTGYITGTAKEGGIEVVGS